MISTAEATPYWFQTAETVRAEIRREQCEDDDTWLASAQQCGGTQYTAQRRYLVGC